MKRKPLAALALVLGSTLAAGAAHAGDRPDVQWSVTFGSPGVGVTVGSPIYAPRGYTPQVYPPQVYMPQVYSPEGYPAHSHGRRALPPRVVYLQPVVVVPSRGVHRAGWRHGYRDSDRDGIPNRYDHHHNPRGDRDHDGAPNWRDRDDRNPYRR